MTSFANRTNGSRSRRPDQASAISGVALGCFAQAHRHPSCMASSPAAPAVDTSGWRLGRFSLSRIWSLSSLAALRNQTRGKPRPVL